MNDVKRDLLTDSLSIFNTWKNNLLLNVRAANDTRYRHVSDCSPREMVSFFSPMPPHVLMNFVVSLLVVAIV